MWKIWKSVMLVVVTVILVAAIHPASASLTAMSYGYPTVYQNGATTAFNRDIVSQTDLETANVDFGATGVGYAFPTISETSDQTYYAEHTDYSSTTESAGFSYPYVSVGDASGLSMLSALSGLGFGF